MEVFAQGERVCVSNPFANPQIQTVSAGELGKELSESEAWELNVRRYPNKARKAKADIPVGFSSFGSLGRKAVSLSRRFNH